MKDEDIKKKMREEFTTKMHEEFWITEEEEIESTIHTAMKYAKTIEDVKDKLNMYEKPHFFDLYFEKYRNTYPVDHPLKSLK